MTAKEFNNVEIDNLTGVRTNTYEPTIWTHDKHRLLKGCTANNIEDYVDTASLSKFHDGIIDIRLCVVDDEIGTILGCPFQLFIGACSCNDCGSSSLTDE